MGLRGTVAIAIDQAFTALDDLVFPITVVTETSTHDSLTLSVAKTPVSHPIAKAALVRFKVTELGLPLNGERGAIMANRTVVESSDRKCIFRQNEDDALVPERSDYVLDPDGKRWNIIAVGADPADIVWLLQLRAA